MGLSLLLGVLCFLKKLTFSSSFSKRYWNGTISQTGIDRFQKVHGTRDTRNTIRTPFDISQDKGKVFYPLAPSLSTEFRSLDISVLIVS